MAVIDIDYEGRNHDYNDDGKLIETPGGLKYQSVNLLYQGGCITFDSGDFIKDWFNAKKHYHQVLSNKQQWLHHSSSVDHFIMDGAEFDSAYLRIVDNEGELKYIDRSDPKWFVTQYDVFEGADEFFVRKGTKPTWKELKEYCEQ
jgi:hypothetical protein